MGRSCAQPICQDRLYRLSNVICHLKRLFMCQVWRHNILVFSHVRTLESSIRVFFDPNFIFCWSQNFNFFHFNFICFNRRYVFYLVKLVQFKVEKKIFGLCLLFVVMSDLIAEMIPWGEVAQICWGEVTHILSTNMKKIPTDSQCEWTVHHHQNHYSNSRNSSAIPQSTNTTTWKSWSKATKNRHFISNIFTSFQFIYLHYFR